MSHESAITSEREESTVDAHNAAVAATTGKREMNECEALKESGLDGEQPSGLVRKKARREAAVRPKEEGDSNATQFPLIPLLNSGHFFGTSLSLANREAYEHTRNLAQYANRIKRFLQKRYRPKMYYDMDDDTRPVYRGHGPATNEGPPAIKEASLDVFFVTFSTADYRAIDAGPAGRSIQALADSISAWWKSVGRYRLTAHRPAAYHLPSGNIVDSYPSSQYLNIRGAVIRAYMKYNNLWRCADPALLHPTNCVSWWIMTEDDDFDKFGWPEHGEVITYVYHNEEGFRYTMEARGFD